MIIKGDILHEKMNTSLNFVFKYKQVYTTFHKKYEKN